MLKNLKVDLKKITTVYIAIFGVLMLIICTLNMPMGPVGEWDDYTLPIASILKEHNISISDADIEYYKELFPNWAGYIDTISLSGYSTRAGGQMTWYFPTYAVACIPFTLLLRLFKLPTIAAFSLTNLAVLMLAVGIFNKYIKASDKVKLLMVLLLTLNPIVFYISWTSGEVFLYSFIVIGLTFWYNKWYKRAAVAISIAGMLNPTIMSVGIVMIAEYIFMLFKNKSKQEKFGSFFKRNILDLIKYGCCYIIGVVPMLYNFYNTGHINLTASYPAFMHGNESTLSRFLLYIFDLNYGVLPYFPILLILSVVFLIYAIVKKNVRYVEWFVTFFLNVLLYSIMVHVNCAMSGISRYNAWGASILIFATGLLGTDLLEKARIKAISFVTFGLSAILTAGVVFAYGPTCASNTSYLQFAPIATWTLDHFPSLYNPLESTFNSRTNLLEGGYYIETPVAYYAEDGYIRKILASENDKDILLSDYISEVGKTDSFIKQVNDLKGLGYISLSGSDKIVKVESINIGEAISFTNEDNSGATYVTQGIYCYAEDWGTWSIGNKTVLKLKTDSKAKELHCEIDACAFSGAQDVTVSINGKSVYHNEEYRGDGIKFDFDNPGAGESIEIAIDIPNAVAPIEFGQNDERVLGLGYTSLIITEVSAE